MEGQPQACRPPHLPHYLAHSLTWKPYRNLQDLSGKGSPPPPPPPRKTEVGWKHLVEEIQVMIGRFLMDRLQWDRELDLGPLELSTRESGMATWQWKCWMWQHPHLSSYRPSKTKSEYSGKLDMWTSSFSWAILQSHSWLLLHSGVKAPAYITISTSLRPNLRWSNL